MVIYSEFSHEKWWFSIVIYVKLPEGNSSQTEAVVDQDGVIFKVTLISQDHLDLGCVWKCSIPSGERWHNYGKWPFIVDFPIKNGDVPLLC